MALEKISTAAARLTCFVERAGIIEPADRTWAFNRIIECCGVAGSRPDFVALPEGYDFEADLAVLAEAGVSAGYAEDTATGRDRLAMRIMGALLPALDALLRRGRGASLAALAALGILSALPVSAPTLLCLNELRLYLFWYFLGFARSEARGADCPVPGPLGLPVALAGLAAFALLMPRMDAPGAVFALTVCGAAALAGLCAALGERSTPVLRLFRGKTYAIYILSLCVQNLVEVVGVHGRWPWAVTALLMLITGLAAPLVIRRLVGALPGEKRATAFLKRVIGY